MARIHWSRNQEVEIGVVLLTITHNDPLAKFLLTVPRTLFSADPEVLVLKGGNASSRRYNNDSIELEVKTATWLLWASCTSETTGKERSNCAGWGN